MCSWRILGMVTNRASSVRPLEIVDGSVAGEPALELRVRVDAANGVDLLDVRRIDRELDAQPVGARRVERHAVAVIGLAADRKSTRLNSSHLGISYAVFCLKKKKRTRTTKLL